MNQQEEALKNLSIMNTTFDRTTMSFKKFGHFLFIVGLLYVLMDVYGIVLMTSIARFKNNYLVNFNIYVQAGFLLAVICLYCFYRFHAIKSYEVFSRQLMDIWGIGLMLILGGRFVIAYQRYTAELNESGTIVLLLTCTVACLLLFITMSVSKRKFLIFPIILLVTLFLLQLLNIWNVHLTMNEWPPVSFYFSFLLNPLSVSFVFSGLCLSHVRKNNESRESN